jgi:hypothetical protein
VSEPGRDPQDALARVRRAVTGAQAQVVDSVARLVKDPSDDRLDRLMRTPARRVVLDGIFWQMPRFLNRAQARGVDATIRWRITGRSDGGTDVYDLAVAGDRCRVTRGETGTPPRLTITVDGAEFVRIASGSADPMKAYFNGRLALAGDILFAAKLTTLFRFPSARPRRRGAPGS